MNSVRTYARENGWLLAATRSCVGFLRRVRDRSVSCKLKTKGFRAGRQPRLLGLSHMRIGAGFHAADDLWLEAVTHSGEQNFAPQLTIGDNVWVSDRVHIACLASVSIGSGTLMGSGCLISDHTHGAYRGNTQTGPTLPPAQRPLHSPAPVVIGRNVWLGDNVLVLPGAVIGDGAVIGAGSLVNGVVPPGATAAGVPARILRRWDSKQNAWLRVQD